MSKFYKASIFLFLSFLNYINLCAQSTETFESATVGNSDFTNGAFTGTLSATSGTFRVQTLTGYGYNSSNKFIEAPHANPASISSTNRFKVSSLYLYPSTDAGNSNQTASVSVTFTGKLNGATVFTYTPPAGDFTAASYNNDTNRGFSLVNFATPGYQNIVIDELVTDIGGAGNYIAIDNFTFTPLTPTTWNGSTWSNGTPDANQDAIIASSTAPATFTCKALTINNSFALNTTGITATVNGNIVNNGNGISGTGTLTINANSTISGTAITIPNSATLNLSSGTLTTGNLLRVGPGGRITGTYANISGSVTLQQSIIAQRGWRVFANPFTTAQTIATVASNNGITINTAANGTTGLTDSRTHSNSTNNWTNVASPTTTWAANTPYALFIRGLSGEANGINYISGPTAFTYNVSGTLNGNSVTVSGISSASNYLIMGNPYAAPVNTQALTGGVSRAYYIYQITQGGNPTAQRTKAGGWIVSGTNSDNTKTIPVLGVLAFIPASTSNFNISTSNINTSGTLQTGLFNTQNNNQPAQIELNIHQQGQLQDRLYIREDKDATPNSNDAADVLKFYNENINFYTKTADRKDAAIDARKEFTQPVQLGISGLTGDYTLNLGYNTIKERIVILKDKYLQKETILETGSNYDFSITADANSKGENRFEIIIQSKLLADAESSSNNGFSAKVLNTVIGNGQLRVQVSSAKPATIQIVDMNGKRIATKAAVNGLNQLNIQQKAKGIYIVQISDGVNMVTEKVVKQ